ncbi:MAG TPA: hypothetical protein VF212_04755 [Longimicrobiales bacterium]
MERIKAFMPMAGLSAPLVVLGGALRARGIGLMRLFSTRPATDERVARLQARADTPEFHRRAA